jgi:hypothetical protein
MLVYVSSREFDPQGSVAINARPTSSLGSLSRRVNRVRTLDGGAYLNDTGQTDADRTIIVRFGYDDTDVDALKRLVTLYPLTVLSCSEGCFLGVTDTISDVSGDELSLSFMVKERLDYGNAG